MFLTSIVIRRFLLNLNSLTRHLYHQIVLCQFKLLFCMLLLSFTVCVICCLNHLHAAARCTELLLCSLKRIIVITVEVFTECVISCVCAYTFFGAFEEISCAKESEFLNRLNFPRGFGASSIFFLSIVGVVIKFRDLGGDERKWSTG